MLIKIGKYSYKVRDRASYINMEALKAINSKYFWKYEPSDLYYEEKDKDGKPVIKQRELDEAEREEMSRRMGTDPDYINEVWDFHLQPLGRAPLISRYLETYKPTEEEEGEMLRAQTFFYTNGTENNSSQKESQNDTEDSQREEENHTTAVSGLS